MMTLADSSPPATEGDEAAAHEALSKSDRRRQAILDTAKDIFLKEGYAAASMSAIAARVGGSKGTLYNYFRSKEELFAAFMRDVCGKQADDLLDHMPDLGDDPPSALTEIGVGLCSLVLSPEVMAISRLVVAESERFPELGHVFYETGPHRGELRLQAHFERAVAQGHLKPGDTLRMARRFKNLCLGDLFDRRMWGIIPRPDPETLKSSVEEAVYIFLCAYGTRPPVR
ncbi:TetR/AcrR family transcriptional regulator [Caulobacter sp. KR2-114]|uniref:TetR/AcrR family transcriptional regulator n=1 Tax=Caulobacter sp. KR2-114 TaxID=3400912 RepID=UPI003BFB8396